MLDEYPEYSTQQVKEISCPFCKEGKIKASYKPSMLRYKVSRVAAKTARVPFRTKEKYEVISEKCPNCGKTRSELKKALEEGVPLSREEIIRRAKAAGLPTRF